METLLFLFMPVFRRWVLDQRLSDTYPSWVASRAPAGGPQCQMSVLFDPRTCTSAYTQLCTKYCCSPYRRPTRMRPHSAETAEPAETAQPRRQCYSGGFSNSGTGQCWASRLHVVGCLLRGPLDVILDNDSGARYPVFVCIGPRKQNVDRNLR